MVKGRVPDFQPSRWRPAFLLQMTRKTFIIIIAEWILIELLPRFKGSEDATTRLRNTGVRPAPNPMQTTAMDGEL